jgi:hypothetical protein
MAAKGVPGMMIALTVADHERNGFIELAAWKGLDEATARAFVDKIDSTVTPDMEPDHDDAPFWFILDLKDGRLDLVGTSERMLPTQVAMMLAPEQVKEWLETRPDPDSRLGRSAPALPVAPFLN